MKVTKVMKETNNLSSKRTICHHGRDSPSVSVYVPLRPPCFLVIFGCFHGEDEGRLFCQTGSKPSTLRGCVHLKIDTQYIQ